MASAKRELPKIIIIQHQGAEPDLGVRMHPLPDIDNLILVPLIQPITWIGPWPSVLCIQWRSMWVLEIREAWAHILITDQCIYN
jgi:hypothetical protein